MGCDCGKPKCDGHCGVSPAVLQINNPSECVLFHRVEVPASMGDSKTNPPKSGAYKNVLLYYEADQTSWLYSSDGVPQKLVNGLTDYEAAINLPQINGVTLIGDKNSADLKLADAPMVITIASGNTAWSGADTAEDIYNFFLNQGKVNVVFEGSENYGYEIVSAAYIPGEQKMMCMVTVAGVDTGSSPVEFAGNALYGLMVFYTVDKAVDVGELDLQPKLSITDFTGLNMTDGYVLEGVPATDSSIGMVKPGDGLEVASDGTLTVIDHVFDTVADMKLATNLVDGSYARTLGFHALNDGGGALYKIREVINTDVVDEAYLIALTDENLVAELLNPDYITPEMMGAYGDGVHDDSAYFDKAKVANRPILLSKNYNLDEYTAENMYFKFKNCEFTGEITFDACTLEGEHLLTNNFNLVSENVINVKEIETRSGRTIKYISGSYNIVENVNFTASENSSNSPCIEVGGSDNTIKNCTFPNGYWIGIRVGGNNTLISDCTFKNQTQVGVNYSGVKITTDENTNNYPDNTIIENCTFYGSQGDNIDTFLGGTHITIKNNTFYSNYGQTLECKSYDYERPEGYNTINTVTDTLIFEGNTVYGYCIFTASFGDSSDYTIYPRNIIVRNNTFYQNNNASQYSVVMASPNAIIEGNKFNCGSNSSVALRVAGVVVDNTIIRNNTIIGGRILSADSDGSITKIILKSNYFKGYVVYNGTNKPIFESQNNYFETSSTAFTCGNIISKGDTFKATTGLITAAGNCDYFVVKDVTIKSAPATQFRASTYTVGNLVVDGISTASVVHSGTFSSTNVTNVDVIANL